MIDRPQQDYNRFGFEVSEMVEKGELHENEFVRIAFFFFVLINVISLSSATVRVLYEHFTKL